MKRIEDNNLYKTMPGRHFLHSVSARMFNKYCRKRKIVSDVKFKDYFWDEEGKSWIGVCCKKSYTKNIDYGSVNYVE